MARWANTLGRYDRVYRQNLYHFIDAYGKNIQIYHITTSSCNSCGWDPLNQEATNPACSTCDGFFLVKEENIVNVKGFINKLDSNRFYREGNNIHQIEPSGDARLTVKLDDVINNIFVSTSVPIISGCEKVVVEGTYYKPKDWERHGVRNLHIMTITLERIRETTQ